MRARVNVDLKLVGPLPDPLLSGDVEVADLLYVKPFSLSGGSLPGGDGETPADGACDEKEGKSSGFTVPPMPGIEAGPFASVRLDVKLHAKKTIRVRMNLANADVSVDGHVGGTGRSPAPSGRITTEDALIFLPTRTLSLRSAEVGFPVEDPTRPRVAASVRTQASGYEVGGSAQGRLPDVDISVWSRPKLPDAQALQLLVTGGLGGGGGGGGGSISVDQALTTATDNLLTAFKGTASPETRPFFDRFTLTVGRQTSRRGQDTIEGEVRVLDQLYFDGERDEFDETNLGVVWRLHFR
jgi:hypothetical protein